MENGAAQAKSEDQNIHGASNTRLVHTSCIEGRQNCRKHTGGPKKKLWKMEQHKPKVQVKTYMELSNTRLVHTSCIWGVTPSTPRFQQMRGIAALILDGFGVFTHYDATQKWGRAS